MGEMRNGIYVKRVDPQKHFMKIYQGYGISESVFDELKADGLKEIRINTGEDLYKISLTDFESHMLRAQYEDAQVFCPIKWFTMRDNKQKELL